MSRIDFLRERAAFRARAAAENAAAMSALGPILTDEIGMPVDVRVSERNTRIVMRMDPSAAGLRVNVPLGTSPDEVADLVRRNEGWARSRKNKMPGRVAFLAGETIPLLGHTRVIVQDASRPFPAKLADVHGDPAILVGRTDFVEARVADLVKSEAQRYFERLTREKALLLGKRVNRVTVKDTSSRWGSCTSSGEISYSWRLALAPLEISEYVVAHEAAHLCEMNHSTRFWKLCGGISPLSPERARYWLEKNGADLMRYGPERG
jgi:predicted metal-dependent hydrolase